MSAAMSDHIDLVVLGTSNCIGQNSFVHQIRPRVEVRLHNLSIGACTSTLGLYQAARIAPTTCGLALVGFALNDGWAYYELGSLWRKEVEDNFRTTISLLRSLNYTPIAVLEPVDMDVAFLPIQEEIYGALCASERVAVVNLRECFRLALSQGGKLRPLMRDRAHMSSAAGKIVGRFFAEVADLVAGMLPIPTRFVSDAVTFRVVEAAELFPADRLVARESRLRGADFGCLKSGQVLRVPASNNERLAAVMINTGAKGATVAIQGSNGRIVKSLTCYWDPVQPEIFSSLLVDMVAPVLGGADGIEIAIVEDVAKPTEGTLTGRPVLGGRYGEVEVEGVLLKGEQVRQQFTSMARSALPLDLADLPAFGQMVDALAALRISFGESITAHLRTAARRIRRVPAYLRSRIAR
jgi:hypothetical protein